jgi:cysteine synthase
MRNLYEPQSRRGQFVSCPREVSTCLKASGVLDSIGNTPLVALRAASEETGCRILAKAEYMNPGGSIKDRIAKSILERAEARGDLRPGMTILEVTSGNTGIALSMVGAVKGYRVVVMMPRTVSEERRHMIQSLGAELRLLDDLLRIQAAVVESEEMAEKDRSLFLPRQFLNPDNPWAHLHSTGPEIVQQTDGRLDAFVMGVGTGGTLMGVGRALRAARLSTKVVAVEPDESAVMSGGKPGRHGIQGLADGFVPEIVRMDEVDEVVRVKTDDAKAMARRLAREEGLLVGISSGANVVAAIDVARRLGPGRTVVTMLCDRGERYLSVGA